MNAVPLAPAQASAAAAAVTIPRDEAPHHAPTEWWYFSGHLWGIDPSGHLRRYGFEYVTFQFLGITPAPVYFGNLAVTDLSRHAFHYAVRQDSYPVPSTRSSFALHTGTWTMRGSAGRDMLHASLPGYRLNLTLQTTKPPALHGHDGVIPYGPFGTSKYYSWTSLLAGGTVVDHGVRIRVLGLSWMDHQWGAINVASGGGWDWFSVQLDSGTQYMVYLIRDRAGKIVVRSATRVDRSGRATVIPGARVREHNLGSWISPATGITYGSGWTLRLPGVRLTIRPDVRDQELDLRSSQGVAYWEGDVSVSATVNGKAVAGVGYTEINPPNAA
jgi:predicted secreted hydrolase